jgi:hypothetical protein
MLSTEGVVQRPFCLGVIMKVIWINGKRYLDITAEVIKPAELTKRQKKYAELMRHDKYSPGKPRKQEGWGK